MDVSALAGTIAAPWVERGRAPSAGLWLRSILSLLVAVAILAVALPVAFGKAGGGGRDGGANPLRVFSSGSLVAPEVDGGASLSVAGMVPGESRSATARVLNAGAAADLSVAPRIADRVGRGGVSLSSVLVLRVEAAGRVLYDGPIGRMPRLRLGGFGAGAERTYRLTATLPSGVGNGVEGSGLSAGFAWNAT